MKDGVLAGHWDVIQDEATSKTAKSGLPLFGTNSSSEQGVFSRDNAKRAYTESFKLPLLRISCERKPFGSCRSIGDEDGKNI